MNKPFSRKRLLLTLLNRAVAPGYAWRAATELADHAEDISEAGLGARARLGDVNELADRIVCAYRRRTFAGRHPLLTFAVAPLPLIVLALAAYWFVGLALILAGSKYTGFAGLIALAVQYLSMVLPGMCLAAWMCRLARGAGLSWRRTTFACIPIVLALFIINTKVSLTEPAHGTFMFGFCLPLGRWIGPAFGPVSWWPPVSMIGTQLLSAALPVCLIMLTFLRERRQALALVSSYDTGDITVAELEQVA